MNIFSIVELLTGSIDDKRATDVVTDCGARIYTWGQLDGEREQLSFSLARRNFVRNSVFSRPIRRIWKIFSMRRRSVSESWNELEERLVLQISDTIIFVISSSKGISIEGDYLLDLIHLHCLPGSVIYSLINSSNDDRMSTSSTSRLSVSRELEKFLEKRFANVKMTALDSEQDGQRLLRKLIEQKLVQATNRCLRPYLFAQSVVYDNPQVTLLLDVLPFSSFFVSRPRAALWKSVDICEESICPWTTWSTCRVWEPFKWKRSKNISSNAQFVSPRELETLVSPLVA